MNKPIAILAVSMDAPEVLSYSIHAFAPTANVDYDSEEVVLFIIDDEEVKNLDQLNSIK
jgi:hypothetical protein